MVGLNWPQTGRKNNFTAKFYWRKGGIEFRQNPIYWKKACFNYFEFTILEEIEKQDEPAFNYKRALEECEQKWKNKYVRDGVIVI